MIDREYFTLVFKGDIGKFQLNPMNTETVFGRPEAAGRGNSFEECEALRERIDVLTKALETIAGSTTDLLQEMIAKAALTNISPALAQSPQESTSE
jgi:hypothetical protein